MSAKPLGVFLFFTRSYKQTKRKGKLCVPLLPHETYSQIFTNFSFSCDQIGSPSRCCLFCIYHLAFQERYLKNVKSSFQSRFHWFVLFIHHFSWLVHYSCKSWTPYIQSSLTSLDFLYVSFLAFFSSLLDSNTLSRPSLLTPLPL